MALEVTRPSPLATIVFDFKNMFPEMSNTEVMAAKTLPTSDHSPYMTIAAPVPKLGHSITIAKSSKKRRLTTATATVTAVVKGEDVLGLTNAAELSHQSPNGETAPEPLLEAMRRVHYVYAKTL